MTKFPGFGVFQAEDCEILQIYRGSGSNYAIQTIEGEETIIMEFTPNQLQKIADHINKTLGALAKQSQGDTK